MTPIKKPKSCINRVLESNHELTSMELLTLISMLSFGDYMTGQNIFPTLLKIAKRSKLGRMTIFRCINSLLNKNVLWLIEDNSKHKRPSRYAFNLNVLAGWEVDSITAVLSVQQGADNITIEPVDNSIDSTGQIHSNPLIVPDRYIDSITVVPNQYNTNILNTNTCNELTARARESVDKSENVYRDKSDTVTKNGDESGLLAPRYAQALSPELRNTKQRDYKSSTARFVESYTNQPPPRDLASLVPCDGETTDLPWGNVHAAINESIAGQKQIESSAPRWRGTNSLGSLLGNIGKKSGIPNDGNSPIPDNPKYRLKAEITNADIPDECKHILIALTDIDIELARKWERWRFIKTNFDRWAIELEEFELNYYSQKFLPQFNQVGLCLMQMPNEVSS